MNKTPRRYFINIIIVSAILHLIALLLFLLSNIDSSVKKYKDLFAKKKQAKVIFKDPSKQQKRLKIQPKIYQPKLVGGALSPTPSKSQIPSTSPQQPTLSKISPPKIAEPTPKPLKKLKPAIAKTPRRDQDMGKKSTEKSKKTKIAQRKTKSNKKPQKKVEEKKLTLADIMKGFKKYAEKNSSYVPPIQQHHVTVLSKNIGKVTEEQLKYERYAAKLFDCIGKSFKLMIRKFRFIKKPSISEVEFELLMHLNQQGKLAGLKYFRGSNCEQFDRFMTKVIQHASESFPPLPQFLKGYNFCEFRLILPPIPIAYIPSANLYSHRNNPY